ncbi:MULTISPECIES: phage baseplate assembly protein [unclassified Oceanobacter]|uniref:phage baseplate assembly protein domain-containing protein n=1 Tax=unclassified Oceanobacter TaxID=2620260 RepID=UPI002735B7B1|nr:MULTISPECIES: phage baseplate assembly protein [unclassified Oceanobacter]MDP2607939.1 phage baseplate assembly protein [Oceanobacter sp. 1_MG-2023]MDP2611399.1 phage baseplate assembly protein [Oceanobacter sp. 2_MG-2023]
MTRDQLIRTLQAFTAPLSRRLRVLLQRSQVLLTKYQGKIRLLQVQVPGGQALSDVEHLEPFGFTSHPPQGAEAIVLAFGGNGSHSVGLLVGDRRYRLVIEEGEAALYNQSGDYFWLKKDGTAEVKSSTKVVLNSPATEITGTLNVTGATTLSSTLNVASAATLQTTLSITETVTAGGQITAPGATFAGAMTAAAASVGGVDYSSHVHSYTDDGNSSVTGGAQ